MTQPDNSYDRSNDSRMTALETHDRKPKIIAGVENIVEQHVKSVKIPPGALFTTDCTIAEMETMLATTETRLTGEVAFTLRELLEDMKISDN